MYSNDLICDILEYIDEFINTKITIESLEHKFFYSRYYIMKKFKKEIGITIFDYLNKYRVNNSIKQINNSNDSLTKIALNNGFYSLEYFSEIFKKEIGVSPQKYKKIIISKYVNDDNYTFALTNIIKINKIINFTQKYKSKRKIKSTPVMKLSIFNR